VPHNTSLQTQSQYWGKSECGKEGGGARWWRVKIITKWESGFIQGLCPWVDI